MSKLQPKIAIFKKKSVDLPSFLHNFRAYTIIYFSDPVLKNLISSEIFGLSKFVQFLPQTLHAPLRLFKMEFWA